MPCTLFISDLHLDPQRPEITRLFLEFLAGRARIAEAVYILGDLFEAWLGDDDDSPLNRAVVNGLRECVDSGTPLHVMRGNRDFLMGEVFAGLSGCSLLDDPARIDLYGTPTLLMHGDLLCTDDTRYMAFRATVRTSGWRHAFLARPLEERRRIAMELRDASREETRSKPEAIMDVNQGAVIRMMQAHKVRRLIHGHTHRPYLHDLRVDSRPLRRLVLGDWYVQGSILECTPEGCRLQTIKPDGALA